MNREKQIEEMSQITHDGCTIVKATNQCRGDDCLDCAAVTLYEKGYRKASDVAREIFEKIGKRFEALLKSYPCGGDLTSAKKFLAVHWNLIVNSITKDYSEEGK